MLWVRPFEQEDSLARKNPEKKGNHKSKEREYNEQSDLVLNMGSPVDEEFVDCGENVKIINKLPFIIGTSKIGAYDWWAPWIPRGLDGVFSSLK